ncbi:MAG: hypothetical protein E7Z86_10610, partial [Methanosphaera stadtmanae]|nr:hypothetical protein [Methanosphaera stadtmanae]
TIASESNKIIKDNKNLKEDPTLIEVNDDNFDDYFKSTGFENNVNDGDTISFIGDISRYNNTTYVVDKQINLLGNDYTITLNTTSGSYFGNETGSSFIFDNGAAGSTVSNINFYNTQVIVRNTTNIVFNNIDQTVYNQRIGQGIGTFSIRDGSSYITVQNSVFTTTNNDNSSTLVLADVQHCTIDNNTITGVGEVGNLLYLTTYNIETTPTENTNSYNIIKYNTINGPSTSSPFCWALVLSGHDNTVFKNIINYVGTAITTQAINVIDENNYQHQISLDNVIANNTVNNAGSVIIITENTVVNNTFTGTLQTGTNSLIENNTVTKKVTAQAGSSLYYNIIFDGVLVNGQNVNLIGNNISKTVNITKNNIYIEYNHICGNVRLTSSFNNVTMQNNIHCGGFIGNKYPSININNTHCGSDCTCVTCGCQSVQLNSNKNLKSDENIIEITKDNVQDYFEIYNEDGDLADISKEVGYEAYIDSEAARRNRGKTYLIDQSAVNALGRNIISLNTNFYNISIVGKNNPIITAYDFSTGSDIPLFANFTIRPVADEYGSPGTVSLVVPASREFETLGIIENITINSRWRTKLEDNQEMVSFLEGNPYTTQRDFASGIVRNCTFNLAFVSDTIDWEDNGRPLAIPIFLPGYANAGHITMENCNINITESDYDGHYATIWGIYNTNNGSEILNNNIYIQGEKYLYSIENKASNTVVNGNSIVVNGTHYTAGVYITGTNMQNNTVENNNITLYSGYHNPGENGPEEDSGYAVVIEDRGYYGGKYDETTGSAVYNNRIINNNITTYGHNIYSVEQYGGKNTTIAGNNISAYGVNPTGIALTGINTTIENNTIIALAQTNVTGKTVDYFPAISAGIYMQLSLNTTIKNNNVTVENGTGIFINRYNNVNITENNITTTDDYGISLNNAEESKVTDNYIIARTLKGDAAVADNNGKDNTIENNLPEVIKEKTFIIYEPDEEYDNTEDLRIQGEIVYGDDEEALVGEDITITLTFSDESQKTYTVTTDEEGFDYSIPMNDLIPGETTLTIEYAGNEIYNQTSQTFTITINDAQPQKEYFLKVDTTEFTIGTNATIKASIYYGNEDSSQLVENITKGKVVFKVNGKTLKDANGKVIYAKVVNGTATIENYEIPERWDKDGITIEAVYSGSAQCDALRSNKEELTINKETTPAITTEDVTATAGSKVTLKATVTGPADMLNNAKVVFKINGKSVKDENGKVIYAKIVNGEVSVEYTIPENFKAKDYTLTATYISSNYDRLEDSKTLTIN